MALSRKSEYPLVISYVSIIIAIVSLILNIIGIHLIRKQDSQRTHQYLIILNLSIIQIPISIGNIGYWIIVLIHGKEPYTSMNWTLPLWISGRIALIMMIAMLTFDRLFAIKYSLRYTIIVSKRKVKIVLSAIWLLCIVSFSVLKALGMVAYSHLLDVTVVAILEGLLLCIILYTYCYIIWRMRRRREILRGISANTQQMQHWNKQALRVSTAIIFSYVGLVLLPDFTDSSLNPFTKGDAWENILLTAHLLDTCYYVALPITYIFLHRDMRKMFVESVVRCYNKKDDMPRSSNVSVLREERIQVATI